MSETRRRKEVQDFSLVKITLATEARFGGF